MVKPLFCYNYNYKISEAMPCQKYPDSKVHGANMGPTWVLSSPDGPHVGPMNLAIRALASMPSAMANQIDKFSTKKQGFVYPIWTPRSIRQRVGWYV